MRCTARIKMPINEFNESIIVMAGSARADADVVIGCPSTVGLMERKHIITTGRCGADVMHLVF